jgi:diacylglycerol kinase family enzyme
MCGLGFDANVIESLHKVRKGSISHLSYIPPIWRELLAFRIIPVSVEVDGALVIDRAIGQLIIANSRQYALRSDPALRATMDDGLTDVVFLPHTTWIGLGAWSVLTRLHAHLRFKRARYVQGKTIRVTAHSTGASVQIDGEYVRSLAEAESVEITTVPSALNVLCV